MIILPKRLVNCCNRDPFECSMGTWKKLKTGSKTFHILSKLE